jgi:microcystin-dependent protein
MSESYVGEIRIWPVSRAPSGWMFCDGSLLAIAEYDVLFALIGTTYGGDGETTFAIPDLRGRVPMHAGVSPHGTYVVGQIGGSESVTLTTNQIPAHSHQLLARAEAATSSDPTGRVLGTAAFDAYTSSDNPLVNLGSALAANGGGQPHPTQGPSLAVNFIISLFGIFPSQS